jgi:hypothetical protein
MKHLCLPKFVLTVLLAAAAACGARDPGRPDGGPPDMRTVDAGAPAGDSREPGPGDAGDGAGEAGVSYLALMPLRPGNHWEYQVREPNQASYIKTQTVEAMEAVGGRGPNAGKQAYRLVTTKVGGAFGLPDKTISWQLTEGSKVVRYREVGYRAGSNAVNSEDYWTPHKLRVDERPEGAAPATGMQWQERYVEYKVSPSTGAVSQVEHQDSWMVTSVGATVTVPAGTFGGCVEISKTSGSGMDTGKSYTFCPGVGKVREVGRSGIGQSEELASYRIAP